MKTGSLLLLELKQLYRNKSFVGLMLVMLLMMVLAAWNSNVYIKDKIKQTEKQLLIVKNNDSKLIAEIDSLNQGLSTFEGSYTLPTSGIRLTYNNHRLAWLPLEPFSLIAIGQGDLFSNYKKIVLYFNNSYEMSSEELVSPLEQLFGQLDLAFVWIYLLPLIILLVSFNVMSIERESGRLSLITSQPIHLFHWLLRKTAIRFLTIFSILMLSTVILLSTFNVDLANNLVSLGQLLLLLFFYCGFWFLLSFLINLTGLSSGRNLIILINVWVLFVFLVPSAVNLLAKEINPIPSRLEVINHHQTMYNEMEKNLDEEMQRLFQLHPDWKSDDPVTKELTNSTGWNINYFAKQYITQLKHRPTAESYETKVEQRNRWVEQYKILSPAMVMQSALTNLAGTSTDFYRSYLNQAQEYAKNYRQYVYKKVFTNYAFSSEEIRQLPEFKFNKARVLQDFNADSLILAIYMSILILMCTLLTKRKFKIN